MIKVSVIIPIYNVEKYVEQCIRSVMEQTLQDIEIICVDDGSTDLSGSIADRCSEKDTRIKVLHKKNTGYGNTINCGIQAARGEYIGIVESDDFAESKMYEKLYTVAKKNNLDYIKANYYEYCTSFRKIHEEPPICEYETVYSEYENMNKLFLTKSIWTGLYKRDFLIDKKIHLLESAGASYQDTSFWFKVCISAHRGMLIKDAFINYRLDNENSSVKSLEKVFCICDEIEECKRYLEQTNLNKDRIWSYFYKYMYNCYQWNMGRINESYLKEFIMQTSQMMQDAKRMLVQVKEPITHTEWLDIKLWSDVPELYYRKIMDRKIIDCNLWVYTNFFSQYLSEKVIYIYGAGKVGRRLGDIIHKITPNCKVCFLVSDFTGNDTDVFLLHETSINREGKVIIAVADLAVRVEMKKNAIQAGFQNIFVLDDMMNNVLHNIMVQEETLHTSKSVSF